MKALHRVTVLAVAVMWLAVGAAAADEPRIDVALEPRTFGLEDTVRLVIRVFEPSGNVGQPELGELENLQVVGGPTRGSEFSFVNGVSMSSVSFTYFVQGLAEGSGTIGPFSIRIEDRTLQADAITVEVVPGSVRPPRSSRRRSPFFDDPFDDLVQRRQPAAKVELRHLIGKRSVVVGEPILATVVLDTTARVTTFNPEPAPKYPGWWAQRVEGPEQIEPEPVEVDGARLNRYTIWQHVLVPLESGTLAIPAVGARIGVGSRSLFDSGQVVDRESAQIEVDVIDRPPPPDGYAGAVGDLKYTASIDPAEIEFGASAVLTVRLEGSGNLPLVEAPPVWPNCQGCETYPPEEESSVKVDKGGIHGSRTWRVTIVPRKSGDLTLEHVTLAVFDPRTSLYRHHTLGPLSLKVAPPPATPTPVAIDKEADNEVSAPREESAGNRSIGWLWIGGALLAGCLVGGLGVWLVGRSRTTVIPPRSNGQSPSERARELQIALERWWLDVKARGPKPGIELEMENLRRDLEAVRFAPGRADHTETIIDLEQRFRELVRRA